MGYRDSDDSGFSRHGIGRDHDEGRYAERSHRGSLERDEPRGTGYGAEFDERSDRYDRFGQSSQYGQYGQYGMERNDYRGDAGLNARFREGRFPSSQERFQGGGGYRSEGRQTGPSANRYESDYRDYQDQNRASYARGTSWSGEDDLRGASQSRQSDHDPDYQQWRQEQLRLLDEDYHSWRKERYQKFSDDFNTWRSSRSSQQPAATGQTGTATGSQAGSTPSSGESKDAS
jgi:hypothetical protein